MDERQVEALLAEINRRCAADSATPRATHMLAVLAPAEDPAPPIDVCREVTKRLRAQHLGG
jgi:hypothetical protein